MHLPQVHDLWIAPELERRRAAGLPSPTPIWRFLLRFRDGQPPLVQLNDEIDWGPVRTQVSRAMNAGEEVQVQDVRRIESVPHPAIDGQPAPYIFAGVMGNRWLASMCFQQHPTECAGTAEREGDLLAENLNYWIMRRIVDAHTPAQRASLSKIGLWLVPTLTPYPISRIVHLIDQGNETEARSLLMKECTAEYLGRMVSHWWDVTEFQARRPLIEQALDAHTRGQHYLSLHALGPQIEGIVTDWTYRHLPADEVPFRAESKVKKFRDLVTSPVRARLERSLTESVLAFVLDGPVLSTFARWFDALDNAFPNRHALAHGRHDPHQFTQENSVKLFLLLDTLHYVVCCHEAEPLGREMRPPQLVRVDPPATLATEEPQGEAAISGASGPESEKAKT